MPSLFGPEVEESRRTSYYAVSRTVYWPVLTLRNSLNVLQLCRFSNECRGIHTYFTIFEFGCILLPKRPTFKFPQEALRFIVAEREIERNVCEPKYDISIYWNVQCALTNDSNSHLMGNDGDNILL